MDRGFTIVELLIVIVVIAILAAITIVSYNVIRNNAYDASVQTDLRNLAGRLAAFEAKTAQYPSSPVELEGLNAAVTGSSYDTRSNAFLYCLPQSTQTGVREYRIVAKSKSGKVFVAGPKLTPRELSNSNFPVGGGATQCSSVGVSGAWWGWFHDSSRTVNNGWLVGMST